MLEITEINELLKIIGLVIGLLIIWLALRKLGKKKKRRKFRSPSRRHLRNQFLRGEISKEEYEKQKKDLPE